MAHSDGRKLIKIKRNGDELSFTWERGLETHSFTSKDRPLGELYEELDGIKKYALESSAYIADDYHDKTMVSYVHFDFKGDDARRNAYVGLCVNGAKHEPIHIKSPKKLADQGIDEAKKGRWDTNAVAQFDKIEEQAFAYIDGEREHQQTMPIFDKTAAGEKISSEQGGLNFDDELDNK